jgi:hypothetical protein
MFKSVLIVFLFIAGCETVQTQSLSLYYGYPYFFMQLESYGGFIEVKNKVNFTVGISLNKYIKSSKLEIGFAYGTKNYYYKFLDTNSTIIKEEIKLKYFFLPVLYNHRLYTDYKNTISIFSGLVFIKPFGYSKESMLKDGTITSEHNIAVNYKIGNTVRLGMMYHHNLKSNLMMFVAFYANYKFIMDYQESSPKSNYSNLTDDRFDIGLSIGFELFYYAREFTYYKNKNLK